MRTDDSADHQAVNGLTLVETDPGVGRAIDVLLGSPGGTSRGHLFEIDIEFDREDGVGIIPVDRDMVPFVRPDVLDVSDDVGSGNDLLLVKVLENRVLALLGNSAAPSRAGVGIELHASRRAADTPGLRKRLMVDRQSVV